MDVNFIHDNSITAAEVLLGAQAIQIDNITFIRHPCGTGWTIPGIGYVMGAALKPFTDAEVGGKAVEATVLKYVPDLLGKDIIIVKDNRDKEPWK